MGRHGRLWLTIALALSMVTGQLPSALFVPTTAAAATTTPTAAAVAPAVSAAPGEIVIGQVGPAAPNSTAQSCGDCTSFQSATDAGSPSYASPVDGLLTSWSVQGPTDVCTNCVVQLRIFRQTAPGVFLAVAQSARQAIDTGLKTFPASIPVRAGDMLGINATNGLRWYPGKALDQITFIGGDAVPGSTIPASCSAPAPSPAPSGAPAALCWFTGQPQNLLNIAATVLPAQDRGLHFNGVPSYDTGSKAIADSAAIHSALAYDFTIDTWVKWDGAAGYVGIVSLPRGNGLEVGTGITLALSDGVPWLAMQDDATVARFAKATAPLTPYRWTHVVASYDGRVTKITTDGANAGGEDYGGCWSVPPTTNPLLLGTEFQSLGGFESRHFGGAIDALIIKQGAVSPTYFCSEINGPSVSWSFDEGVGTVAYGTNGGPDAILYNDTTWVPGHTTRPVISGTVRTRYEAPVAGVKVELRDGPSGALEGDTTTDALGRYSIAAGAGSHFAFFTPSEASRLPSLVYPNKVSAADATPIVVTDADRPGVNVVLLAGHTLTGRVVDTAGTSQPDVPVQVYLGDRCCYAVREARTNSDGFYAIALADGFDYKMRAAATPSELWWNGKPNPGSTTQSGWDAATPFRMETSGLTCRDTSASTFIDTWDALGVTGGGTPPTFSAPAGIVAGLSWCVTEISTYHLASGVGSTGGTVLLRGPKSVGPLSVQVTAATTGYTNWSAYQRNPAVSIPGGVVYSCVDSDPVTWAHSAGKPGYCRVTGVPLDTSTTPSDRLGMDFILGVTSRITGVAKCGDPRQLSTYVTLGGATVTLLSGVTPVATVLAGEDGSYTFTNTAALTTFGIRYTSLDGKIVCSVSVQTDAAGNAVAGLPQLSLHNGTWNTAFQLPPLIVDGPSAVRKYTVQDYLFAPGQSHWFKFTIRPGQKVLVKVTGANGTVNLPADYSLALFKDIRQYFDATHTAFAADPMGTISRQDAATAPDALSPDALSPDALSPDALSPDALSPDALSPDALSPDALSPDALSPDELSPDALSPDALSPDALSPDALSPDALSPDAYSGAQTATLLRVSAHQGNSPEQVRQNTWTNTGNFYIRVRGHNGAYAPADAFTVTAETVDSACSGVTLVDAAPTPPTVGGATKTLILTHTGRIDLTAYPLAPLTVGGAAFTTPRDAFVGKLQQLAGRPGVGGVVLDLAENAGLIAAYQQWTGNGKPPTDPTRIAGSPTCPAAANIVAEGIRKVVDAYRARGLEYVVLVGGDGVIPFYRNPDEAGLGNENMYKPGLQDDSASKASLEFGFVLTQDFYVGRRLQRGDHEYFKPELPIGRLVETATDAAAVIDAYLAVDGVVSTAVVPGALLDTGYDFLADTAKYVKDTLGPALPSALSATLVTQPAPNNVNPWTAAQLRALLTTQHYTVASLNGHFSANSALAADYATRVVPTDLIPTLSLLQNTLVLSTGCHSGYNIYNSDALPQTKSLDFPQLFAQAGATLIGGTGYQYGDTDFMKYSELILGNVALELTYGTGPVTIGSAHLNSKMSYLASLSSMRGIDEKAVEESTLYGLPMWSIDLGAGRRSRPTTGTGVTPIGELGLRSADVAPSFTLTKRTDPTVGTYYDAGTVQAPSISVSPGLPVVPFVSADVHSTITGYVARGVVLLGTDYIDEGPVMPFTSAVGTETSVLHPGFASTVFAPGRPYGLNKLSGETLTITPTQYKTTAGNTGTLRRWTTPSFKVFYSNSTTESALAAAPVIHNVTLTKTVDNKLQVDVTVSAAWDPGIQALYVTSTAPGAAGGAWVSVLAGMSSEVTAGGTPTAPTALTRTYRTVITPVTGKAAEDYQVFVQAVGGNGLVSMSTNGGAYFQYAAPAAVVPIVASTPKTPTVLTITNTAVTYLGTTSIDVTAAGTDVNGLPLRIALGTRSKTVSIANGAAHVDLAVTDLPGTTAIITATLNEDATHLASGAEATAIVGKGVSKITAVTPASIAYATTGVIGRLTFGIPQDLQDVTLSQGALTLKTTTDGYGRIRLDTLAFLPPLGPSTIHVAFLGNDLFGPASADIPITLVAAPATVAIAPLSPLPTGNVPVSATVTVPGGDITKARVSFALRNEAGTVVASFADLAVSATGAASATFTAVAGGLYHVEATVTGGYYTSPLASVLAVVYDTTDYSVGVGIFNTSTSSSGVPIARRTGFAFAAKYVRGQTKPSGALEVNVEKAGFNFLAAPQFDWLVTGGGRAEVQGTGYVNRIGGYSFRLIATDATPDTFELRIWTTTSSFDAPLYKLTGTVVSGNIVVH